jgi:hypothetical protein
MSHVPPDELEEFEGVHRSTGHVDDDKKQSSGLEKLDAPCSQRPVRSQGPARACLTCPKSIKWFQYLPPRAYGAGCLAGSGYATGNSRS